MQPDDIHQTRPDRRGEVVAYRNANYDDLERTGRLNEIDAYIELQNHIDNHLIVMWGSKGGAGTTVTAAAAAIHETSHVLLVDLAGDCAAVLGVREHDVGVRAWLASDAEPARLTEFVDPVDSTTSLLQAGRSDPDHGQHQPRRLQALADWLGDQPGIVIVDAGTGHPPAEIVAVADKRVLVTRADYLALRAGIQTMIRPDEIFVVNEPGRALGARDVESVVGAPITGSVDLDPAIARAVDSGLFVGHASLNHATSKLTGRDTPAPAVTHGPEVDYGMQWTNVHNAHTFRLSYDPTSRELAFTDNTTGDRHPIGHYTHQADVGAVLDGWATHHADNEAGLDWVHSQTMTQPVPTAIDDLMTPSTIAHDTANLSIEL